MSQENASKVDGFMRSLGVIGVAFDGGVPRYVVEKKESKAMSDDSAFEKALREECDAMAELIPVSPPLILDDGQGRSITVTKDWLAKIVGDFEEQPGAKPPVFFHAEPDGTMKRCTPECVAEHLDSARTTLRMRSKQARRNFKKKREEWREENP